MAVTGFPGVFMGKCAQHHSFSLLSEYIDISKYAAALMSRFINTGLPRDSQVWSPGAALHRTVGRTRPEMKTALQGLAVSAIFTSFLTAAA